MTLAPKPPLSQDGPLSSVEGERKLGGNDELVERQSHSVGGGHVEIGELVNYRVVVTGVVPHIAITLI